MFPLFCRSMQHSWLQAVTLPHPFLQAEFHSQTPARPMKTYIIIIFNR